MVSFFSSMKKLYKFHGWMLRTRGDTVSAAGGAAWRPGRESRAEAARSIAASRWRCETAAEPMGRRESRGLIFFAQSPPPSPKPQTPSHGNRKESWALTAASFPRPPRRTREASGRRGASTFARPSHYDLIQPQNWQGTDTVADFILFHVSPPLLVQAWRPVLVQSLP